jgi:hypothetical protein
MSFTCPYGGNTSRPNAMFCAHCGRPIPIDTTVPMMLSITCPSCGQVYRSDAKFYAQCRVSLTAPHPILPVLQHRRRFPIASIGVAGTIGISLIIFLLLPRVDQGGASDVISTLVPTQIAFTTLTPAMCPPASTALPTFIPNTAMSPVCRQVARRQIHD